MENTKYVQQFNKSDCYAITQRLRKAIPEDYDLIIKRRKSSGSCLEFEFSDTLCSNKDFYLELVFIDNACLVMDVSGEVPFDVGIIYTDFIKLVYITWTRSSISPI